MMSLGTWKFCSLYQKCCYYKKETLQNTRQTYFFGTGEDTCSLLHQVFVLCLFTYQVNVCIHCIGVSPLQTLQQFLKDFKMSLLNHGGSLFYNMCFL